MAKVSFDRAVDFYDATRGYNPGVAEQIREAIVNHTGITTAQPILEMGVGTGRIALPFIQAGYNYTGVDISMNMMQRLVQKLDEAPAQAPPRYRLYQADVTSLPFADGTFKLAVAVHLFHLIRNWEQAIHEARRVLQKNGGTMLIAKDTAKFKNPAEATEFNDELPGDQVHKKWDQILEELGVNRKMRNLDLRNENTIIVDYLKTTGAQVEQLILTRIPLKPFSYRDVGEQHKSRIYSSDWNTPDSIHQEASHRLEQWLNQAIADPDQKPEVIGEFNAVVARWV